MSQFYTDEDTTEDGIQALGAELTDDDAPETEAPDAPETEASDEKPAKKESSKTPVPEGYEAPVAFAKRIGLEQPQPMYGYVKNNKALQEAAVLDRGEGVVPRQVIHIEKGLEWWEGMKVRKAERATAKAAKAEESTPETEGSTE